MSRRRKLALLSAILILFTLASFSACDSPDGENNSQTTRPSFTLPAQDGNGSEDIVDLSSMSATMAYATLNDIFARYGEYQGRKIRVSGTFEAYYSEETDRYYYSCIINDAAGCCILVIEFLLAGDATYPDDYPPSGSQITVNGIFDTYEENGYLFSQLTDAILE